nr:Txe/YoeB family addiction module toxin [Plantibacter sp. MMLR14_011]
MAITWKTARTGARSGIGKPEALKHGFQGFWSRRITDEHRLVYRRTDDGVLIAQARFHYE